MTFRAKHQAEQARDKRIEEAYLALLRAGYGRDAMDTYKSEVQAAKEECWDKIEKARKAYDLAVYGPDAYGLDD